MSAPLAVSHQLRRRRPPSPLTVLLLGALLAASQVQAQTQPNSTTLPQSQRPASNTARPGTAPTRPGTTATQPASRWHLPFFGAKQNTNGGAKQNTSGAAGTPNNGGSQAQSRLQAQQHFWKNLFHRNGDTQQQQPQQLQQHPLSGSLRPLNAASGHASGLTSASHPLHLASRDLGPTAGSAAQSNALLGPSLPGTHIAQSPGGSLVRTAADGSIIDVHNPKNGMLVQHGLDGSRRVTVEQPDGSRIFAAAQGVGYVQHPYLFHSQPFDHRTRYTQGQLSQQFYRPYEYAGKTLDVYAPRRFYSADFYRSISARYGTPLVPQWNYVTQPTPWFGYYKSYFTPASSYSSPLLWLTDFVLATSLIQAYQAHPQTTPAPAAAGATVTPEVKEMVADEVNRQVKEESVEARENAQAHDPAPGAGGVVKELQEKEPHVFVADADLDLVDPSGRRCMLSEGDVVQVISAAHERTGSAQAVVLASKGPGECERSARVDIAVSDLQEMQNHMRETIDQGLASSRAGGEAQTVTPAFAAAAPPPDPNAAQEIQRQQEIAAAADG